MAGRDARPTIASSSHTAHWRLAVPVAVHISPRHMSKQDYERVISDLEAAGVKPGGRLYHAAYGDDEVEMFEVWETREQFEDHREALFARLQGSGVDGGIVQMHTLHAGGR
jgi:quinol monooxygenase YgiN